jgi:hypothetical protein
MRPGGDQRGGGGVGFIRDKGGCVHVTSVGRSGGRLNICDSESMEDSRNISRLLKFGTGEAIANRVGAA